jgi:NADH dehydrogenase (ubiquinone) Fe-S protein 1
MISLFPYYLLPNKKNIIFINNKKIYLFRLYNTIIRICEFLNINIPRFCYHQRLSLSGNCRMCMVQLKFHVKPVVSCTTLLLRNMHIYTTSYYVRIARENVMEFLLINHPLDCPICDQGGECDLQDQAIIFGSDRGRFKEIKRSVQDIFLGPVVKTIMTRCIHCTRCVRFSDEIIGDYTLGRMGRGDHTEISTYIQKYFLDELSGNIVDLCPVGALTSKSYAFKARPWELKSIESIDIFDSLGSNIKVDIKGNEIMRILPKRNDFLNEEWITDKIRFSYEALKKNRIVYPMLRINKNEPLKICSKSLFYNKLYENLFKLYNIYGKNLVNLCKIKLSNFFTSALDYFYIYNLFPLLGITNIITDKNHINYDFRYNYLINEKLNRFEWFYNYYILNNINLKKENPIINSRIKKVKLFKGRAMTINYIGSNINFNYDHIHLSNSNITFLLILEGKYYLSYKLNKNDIQIINGINFFNNINSSNIEFENIILNHNINFSLSTILPTSSLITLFDLGYANIYNSFYYRENKLPFIYYLYNTENNDEVNYDNYYEIIYHGTHIDEKIKKFCTFLIPSFSFFEENLLFTNILGYTQHTSQVISSSINIYNIFNLLTILLNHINNNYFKSIYIYINQLKEMFFYNIYPYNKINYFFYSLFTNYKFLNIYTYIYLSYNFNLCYINEYYKTDNISLNSETLQKCSLLLSYNNFDKNLLRFDSIV